MTAIFLALANHDMMDRESGSNFGYSLEEQPYQNYNVNFKNIKLTSWLGRTLFEILALKSCVVATTKRK